MPTVPSDAPDLFDCAAWATVIGCLGARCWFGIDRENDRRVSLFVWDKGPVRVGFVGFPVSPMWLLGSTCEQFAQTLNLPERIDLLRANFSMLDTGTRSGLQGTSLPESTIPDLASWPIRHQTKNRKDLALAVRRGVILSNGTVQDADALFSIYANTIARNRGRLRYNQGYFSALIAMSESRADMQVRVARHEENLIGFCVAVKHADRGYYLHAGVADSHRQFGAADILADDAIRWAMSTGCRSFSLMASPPNQPGLQKFKQKWAEVDGQWVTSDTPRGLLGRLVWIGLSLAW